MSAGPTRALAGVTGAAAAEHPAAAARPLRIGELAELTGTTPRTIRYYEELGLLGRAAQREQGKHRCYRQADVDRLREVIRLRDLLGLSLDELSRLLEAEEARMELRREYHATQVPAKRTRILRDALGHLDTQLELVQGRLAELQQLADELTERREYLRERIEEPR